jgi:hypothetical protein
MRGVPGRDKKRLRGDPCGLELDGFGGGLTRRRELTFVLGHRVGGLIRNRLNQRCGIRWSGNGRNGNGCAGSRFRHRLPVSRPHGSVPIPQQAGFARRVVPTSLSRHFIPLKLTRRPPDGSQSHQNIRRAAAATQSAPNWGQPNPRQRGRVP